VLGIDTGSSRWAVSPVPIGMSTHFAVTATQTLRGAAEVLWRRRGAVTALRS
jgi:hypothetical protein